MVYWGCHRALRCSHRAKFHLLQYRTAEQAVGIGELFPHFEVIVVLHDQEGHRLARSLDGGGEIAALALELRRLRGPVDQYDWRHQFIEMTLSAEFLLGLVGELDISRSCGKPHRL